MFDVYAAPSVQGSVVFNRSICGGYKTDSKDLLLRTSKPIKQIAAAAGFQNEKSFSRAFQGWTGASPGVFRQVYGPDLLRAQRLHQPVVAGVMRHSRITWSASRLTVIGTCH